MREWEPDGVFSRFHARRAPPHHSAPRGCAGEPPGRGREAPVEAGAEAGEAKGPQETPQGPKGAREDQAAGFQAAASALVAG